MNGLRIISGRAKGMRILPVPGDTTRPITDRVKESLFNIIGPDIQQASMLDLFGGTGSVGIEALSRGAEFVRFIDFSNKACQVIKKNLDHTHLTQHNQVVQMDAFTHISKSPDMVFDYIYIAPPQYLDMWEKAIKILDEKPGWLSENGWVIVQIHPVEYKPLELVHFREFDQRKYGSTLLVFYENT